MLLTNLLSSTFFQGVKRFFVLISLIPIFLSCTNIYHGDHGLNLFLLSQSKHIHPYMAALPAEDME